MADNKTYDDNGNVIKTDESTEQARRKAFEQISKKAILVNMVRRQISNLPFDVQFSNKVAKEFGIKDSDMIQIRKFLYAPQHLSKIRCLINDALVMVWNLTRPWSNTGYRLLPMEYYDDFKETFGKIKDDFEIAVKEFVDNYDSYVAESKENLGKAFNKNDYPDKSQVADLFQLDIETANFPDIDDIRLNMSGPELMQMQSEITDKYKSTLTSAMDDLLELAKKGDAANAKPLIELVKKLNILDSPEIEMKLTEVTTELGLEEDDSELSEKDMMVMSDIDDMNEEEPDDFDDDVVDLL